VVGLGAAGLEAGTAAAAGVGGGAGTGVVIECSVKGLVEAVDDLGADLLAQVGWDDGAGNKVLVGPDSPG
jgi:hypothetical protein